MMHVTLCFYGWLYAQAFSLEHNVDIISEQSFNFWRRDIKLLHFSLFYKKKKGYRNKVLASCLWHTVLDIIKKGKQIFKMLKIQKLLTIFF